MLAKTFWGSARLTWPIMLRETKEQHMASRLLCRSSWGVKIILLKAENSTVLSEGTFQEILFARAAYFAWRQLFDLIEATQTQRYVCSAVGSRAMSNKCCTTLVDMIFMCIYGAIYVATCGFLCGICQCSCTSLACLTRQHVRSHSCFIQSKNVGWALQVCSNSQNSFPRTWSLRARVQNLCVQSLLFLIIFSFWIHLQTGAEPGNIIQPRQSSTTKTQKPFIDTICKNFNKHLFSVRFFFLEERKDYLPKSFAK